MRLVVVINQLVLLLCHYQRGEGHAVPLSVTAALHFLFARAVIAQHDGGVFVEPIWTLPLQAIHVAVAHQS